MSDIKNLFGIIWTFLNHDMTIYGYTFSFFDLFVLGVLVSIASYVIYGIFGGE